VLGDAVWGTDGRPAAPTRQCSTCAPRPMRSGARSRRQGPGLVAVIGARFAAAAAPARRRGRGALAERLAAIEARQVRSRRRGAGGAGHGAPLLPGRSGASRAARRGSGARRQAGRARTWWRRGSPEIAGSSAAPRPFQGDHRGTLAEFGRARAPGRDDSQPTRGSGCRSSAAMRETGPRRTSQHTAGELQRRQRRLRPKPLRLRPRRTRRTRPGGARGLPACADRRPAAASRARSGPAPLASSGRRLRPRPAAGSAPG
jgi:hypothetical protein